MTEPDATRWTAYLRRFGKVDLLPFAIAMVGGCTAYATLAFTDHSNANVVWFSVLAVAGLAAGLFARPGTGWVAAIAGDLVAQAIVLVALVVLAIFGDTLARSGGIGVIVAILTLGTVVMILVTTVTGGLAVLVRMAAGYLVGRVAGTR